MVQASPMRTLSVLAVMALAAVGCGNSRAGQGAPPALPEGPRTEAMATHGARIKGSGASFPDAFYQEAVAGLDPVAPKLSITYEAVGSAAGREAFGHGLNDFAGTDSLVGDDEPLEAGTFHYIPAVAASIAVVANVPGVDDLKLDADTLAGVFQGDIERWDDPAIVALNPDADLPSSRIIVARRSDGAGTTKNFTSYLDRASERWRLGSGDTVEWSHGTQGGQQNAGVAQIVQDAPGAIGYVDLGNALELDLGLVALRNAAGEFVLPDVDSTKAAVASAELTPELTLDPLDAPGEGAYPITATTYLLVRDRYDAKPGEALIAWIGWLITEGADTYAADLGFAPLPDGVRERALERLSEIEIS